MSAPGRAPAEQRKLVSVVFADVVGSTAFGADNDPEAVRAVMASYFERMKGIAELHGGTVEKFIGDAVMVVFGIPKLHDDDAERAVRAALAMRDAMADLNRDLGVSLAARVGVNTGEAVTGAGREGGQFLVTGDPVNVAARLQQAAEPGEVLAGPITESLTRAAIEYERHAAVAAKGKDAPLPSFRALRPRSAIPEQARGLPAMRAQLVGRQRELRLLLDTFDRVRSERRAHLFTLVGNAGIGKSRLVGEVLARVGATSDARVLRGRCLPYGAGITYWPLIEIVRDDAGIGSADHRDDALAKLDRRTADLHGASAVAIHQRLAVMLGLRDVAEALPATKPEGVAGELAWALQEHVVAIAREPVVIVVDDLQWAEAPVFDAIEGFAERAQDAPLLLLCVARPQLLEARPAWGAGRANAATIALDALSPAETATLISRLLDVDDLPSALRDRVVERSEGNPLFCEEFLRMLIDEGRVARDGERWRATRTVTEVRVPESIHALLAARLDGLGDEERRALQVASVVGERFAAAELAALAPDVDLPRALASLRRTGLVLEDRETRERDRYRFKHVLMRDVAYAALPKAARADLHEAFARELDRSVGDRRGEFAEIVAHHVERAFALSAEVRAPRAVLVRRARAALDHALALGERARARQDLALLLPYAATAAAALAALGGEATDDDRVEVALLAADERSFSAAHGEAVAAYEDVVRIATALGRPELVARAHLGIAGSLIWSSKGSEGIAAFERHAAEAERLYREAGDTGGEIEAGLAALEKQWHLGEVDDLIARGTALATRARAAGDRVRELFVCARIVPAFSIVGQHDLAAEYAKRAADLVAALGVRTPNWLRVARCADLRQRGDLDAADACYVEIAQIAKSELDYQMLMAPYRNNGETLILERRRYAEGAALVDRGLAEAERLNDTWNRAEMMGSKAITLAAAGDHAAADALLAQARALAQRGDVFAEAYLAYCEGRMRELAGRAGEALAAYADATRRFRGTGFERHFMPGLVHLDEARLLLELGRVNDAAAKLAEAEGILGEQAGERARRIAALRAQIAGAAVRPEGR